MYTLRSCIRMHYYMYCDYLFITIEQCPFFMRYDQPTKKIIMNDLDYYIVDGRVNLGRLYKRNRPPLQNIIPMGAQYSKKVFLGGLPTDMDEGLSCIYLRYNNVYLLKVVYKSS